MDEFSDFLSNSGADFYDAMEEFDDVIPASFDLGNNEENNETGPETAPAESSPSMQLLPPPTGKHYPTFNALFEAANVHAARQGYAVAKAGNKKNGNGAIVKTWLKCSRGHERGQRGQQTPTVTGSSGIPHEMLDV